MTDAGMVPDVEIVIVLENQASVESLKSGWGLACAVRTQSTLGLFDTGPDGAALLHNLGALAIDPADIEWIVLSHDHFDHTGGLAALLQRNRAVSVFVHNAFSAATVDQVTSQGGTLMELQGASQIAPSVYVTGPLRGTPVEQALIVQTSEGLVVLTGCSHPGLDHILRRVRDMRPEPIELVVGGFHLGGHEAEAVRKLAHSVREMGVHRIAPLHCTGAAAVEIFREVFGEDCVAAGGGSVLTVGR